MTVDRPLAAVALSTLLALGPASVPAQDEAGRGAAPGDEPGVVEMGADLLERSKEAGRRAWDAAREMGEKALESSREVLASLPGGAAAETDLRVHERAELSRVWDRLVARLDAARGTVDRIERAPESSWFGEDRESLREDFVSQLDELVVLLDDASIFEYRDEVDRVRGAIHTHRQRIQEWREARLLAEDRSAYDARIAAAERSIEELEDGLRDLERELQRRLRYAGVDLDVDQVRVLLTRVDSDDIIQMAAVFQVLRRITEQLRVLIDESGESIEAARRYYGMHVVLLEAVSHVQRRYIELVSSRYLPRVDAIAERTEAVREETLEQLDETGDERRRALYRKNLDAQGLTLRVARLYAGHLEGQREKVRRALETIERDLALARNTYQTVNLSADLYHLLEASEGAWRAVLELQVPDIVPFENLELARRYAELSVEIERGAETPG